MVMGDRSAEGRRIRPGTEVDIPICASLIRDWVDSVAETAADPDLDPDFDYEADLHKTLVSDHEGYFVAEDEDGVQGFITVRAGRSGGPDLVSRIGSVVRRLLGHPPRRNRMVGTIDQVVMRPGRRNNYMSLGLLKEVTEWCTARNLVAIEATVWPGNTRTLRVSERVGFQPVKILIRKQLD